MAITTKNRVDLKAYFVKNAIPTEQNFSDLVDGQLNQAEDGVFKLPGEPLGVVAASGDQRRALRLYGEYPAANPDWMIGLNPRGNPEDPNSAKPGFGVSDGAGNTRLFIDAATGNLGVGTNAPNERLSVAGNAVVGGDVTMGTNAIKFTSGWTGFPDAVTNQAEISNDIGTYKTLMLVGNRSGGAGVRRVGIWDALAVNGTLTVTSTLTVNTTATIAKGAKLHEIGIGTQEHGATGYPYETIQMNPSHNLRVWFALKERFVMQSNGAFRIYMDNGYWVFQTDGNLVKYRNDGTPLWHLGLTAGTAGW